MKKLITIAILFEFAGCANIQTAMPTYTVQAPFDRAQAALLLQNGTGTIKGNAFLRQNGGGVVTCAGSTVTLIPATEYAKERISRIYGNSQSGVVYQMNFKFSSDEPEYLVLNKTTKCDSQGNFEFDNVASGEFFVSTMVSWTVGYSQQGGVLMHRYSIAPGQTVSHVLAP